MAAALLLLSCCTLKNDDEYTDLLSTVADWVLIIGLKISHFFATALILKACIKLEIQLGCYQMNAVTPKYT